MKTQLNLGKRIPLLGILFVLAGSILLSQCKDDELTALNATNNQGEYKVNTQDGSWRLDKSHSSINWKTAYIGDQAFLTGKFNSFDIDVEFDQADLKNSKISAFVVVSTCNTGEPGRDNLGKCLNGYLGVKHNGDTLPNGSLDPAGIDGSTDTARFTSSSITAYGSGYKAVGMLDFKGKSNEVEMFFTYITEKDYSTEQDGSKMRASFLGNFDFNAQTDYGVTSTSIADIVSVNINCIVRND